MVRLIAGFFRGLTVFFVFVGLWVDRDPILTAMWCSSLEKVSAITPHLRRRLDWC